jgi:uncharacterized membrane protein YagU involved in acid resistance
LARGVVIGGVLAGMLDIADALIFHGVRGVPPVRILQAIASGLVGADAFQGGLPAAALGLGLHFVIALAAAAVYGLASRQLPLLLTRPWVSGALFGLSVHAVMQYVVLPLSAFRPGRTPADGSIDWALVNPLAAHVLFVGWPIALSARWAANRRVPL